MFVLNFVLLWASTAAAVYIATIYPYEGRELRDDVWWGSKTPTAGNANKTNTESQYIKYI